MASTPLHSGRMQLLVTFEPKLKFERGYEQPSGPRPGTQSEMACHEEPDGLCKDSLAWCSRASEKTRRTSSLSPPLFVAWLASFLPWQGASRKGIEGLIRTHKVVTADDILIEAANCSMQK